MIDSIRLGSRAKNQLISLKRKTGIPNWNVLCRWAFVLSLRETSRPRQVTDPLEDGVEMTWRTFGGDYADIYEALIKARCLKDEHELTPSELSRQLRQHIYRGIGYLASSNRITSVAGLSALATVAPNIDDASAQSDARII
jgi:DNA sulfur modification protein DndE